MQLYDDAANSSDSATTILQDYHVLAQHLETSWESTPYRAYLDMESSVRNYTSACIRLLKPHPAPA